MTGWRRLVGVAMAVGAMGCVGPETAIPECAAGGRLTILSQAVPSASMIPCIQEMPIGWSFAALDVESGNARFWLNSDRAGARAVEVSLRSSCDVGVATEIDGNEEGVERFQRLDSLSPRFTGTSFDRFEGGCVSYRYDLTSGAHISLHEELHEAVGLFSRQELAAELERDLGLDLDP